MSNLRSDILYHIQDRHVLWRERYFLKQRIAIPFIHINEVCGNLATTRFGGFNVSKWGGEYGCGFNIWEAIPGGKKKKLWIDIDPYLNVATSVKDESGILRGIDDVNKNEILKSMDKIVYEGGFTDTVNNADFIKTVSIQTNDLIKMYYTPSSDEPLTTIVGPNYEMRTPDNNSAFFEKLFPNGYYTTEDSTKLIGGPSKGGRRKKLKNTKRKNRSKNITKSKR